jgi:hypothetical protein
MKNKFTIICHIVIVAVVFGLSSCVLFNDSVLIVENQNPETITAVSVTGKEDWTNLNIATNESRTFPMPNGPYSGIEIVVQFGNNQKASLKKYIAGFTGGEHKVRLTSDGSLE